MSAADFPRRRRRPRIEDLAPDVLRRIKDAFAEGLPKTEIGARFGLSSGDVRKALKL